MNRETKKEGFALDVANIRARARGHIENGAVTEGYALDRNLICKILNEVLATEIVCTLRYRRHYFMSATVGGIAGFAVTDELLEHAQQEQEHADRVAKRIVQLGGQPDLNPATLTSRSHAEYVEGDGLPSMLREDLIAERIAIDTYREIVRFIGDRDPTTRRMLEDILEQEEEHADDLSDFLRKLDIAR